MNDNKKEKEDEHLLMNGRGKANGVIEEETFSKFLFNKEKGTCLGRTARSWFEITLFYVIFYACLAAFWIACLALFLKTLDDKVPRYYGAGTIMGINPGLGYQPWMNDDPDSTLITWNTNDNTSYVKYVKRLDEYLAKYHNHTATRVCKPPQRNKDVINPSTGKVIERENDTTPVESCRFDLEQFATVCDNSTGYGFADGKPCIILSLNRMIGWEPADYEEGSVPDHVKDRYEKGHVTMYCNGTSDFDKEYIGNVTYIPDAGIDGRMYYPYVVMENYHQPIAMVKFESLPRNKLVLVECRAFASNIEQDITAKLGLVNFEILIEDHEVEEPKKER